MSKPRPDKVNRMVDERDLRMIDLRCKGYLGKDIGIDAGVSESYVRAATNRIKKADIEHAGDPIEEIQAEYW